MNRLLSGFAVSGCQSAEQFLADYRLVNPHIERVRAAGSYRVHSAIRAFDLPRSRLVVDAPDGVEILGSSLDHLFVILPLGPGMELDPLDRAENAPFVLPRDEYVCRVSGPQDRIYFGVPRSLAEGEIIGDHPDRLAIARQGRLAGHRLQLFQSQVLRVIGAVDEAPNLVLSHPRFRAAQEELLFLSLAHAFGPQEGEELTLPRAHRRALDFIEAHFRDDIRLADVAAAAGTSVRSLQIGFRCHENTTLTRFIRERRLSFAHLRLSRATPFETVTGIALDSGFNHLGEFSLAYRERFGETPSETLRQVRSAPAQGRRRAG